MESIKQVCINNVFEEVGKTKIKQQKGGLLYDTMKWPIRKNVVDVGATYLALAADLRGWSDMFRLHFSLSE